MGQFDYPFVHNGYVAPNNSREVLNKSISLMVRQAHHERNQTLTVRPEPVEGFDQRFPKRAGTNYSLSETLTYPNHSSKI
jgi:hypothetical protein